MLDMMSEDLRLVPQENAFGNFAPYRTLLHIKWIFAKIQFMIAFSALYLLIFMQQAVL
jgi:hypothetical protein